jgi:hypothetical protein
VLSKVHPAKVNATCYMESVGVSKDPAKVKPACDREREIYTKDGFKGKCMIEQVWQLMLELFRTHVNCPIPIEPSFSKA